MIETGAQNRQGLEVFHSQSRARARFSGIPGELKVWPGNIGKGFNLVCLAQLHPTKPAASAGNVIGHQLLKSLVFYIVTAYSMGKNEPSELSL